MLSDPLDVTKLVNKYRNKLCFAAPEMHEYWWKEFAEALTLELAWRPIATAPKDGTAILFSPGCDDEHALAYWSNDSWRVSCCGQTLADGDITHWKPRPQPHDQQGGNEDGGQRTG